MKAKMKDIGKYHSHALNVGLGVQSTATALMCMNGDLPKPDCFIFADTQWEREGSYENYERLSPMADEAGIPFHVIKTKNIRQAQLTISRSGTELPYYIDPSRYETVDGLRQLLISDVTKYYHKQKKIEKLFEVTLDDLLHDALTEFDSKVEAGIITEGYKKMDRSQMGRQCTYNYKILPIQKFLRKHYGAHFKRPMGTWLGISIDEWTRMADSETKAFVNFYPLVDYKISRDDCKEYMEKLGYPVPVRSSCVGCPFSSNDVWREKSDAEIQDASEFEEEVNQAIQDSELKDRPYYANGVRLHRSMKPISERPFDEDDGEEESICGGGCFL